MTQSGTGLCLQRRNNSWAGKCASLVRIWTFPKVLRLLLFAVTGSAPIAAEVLEELRIVFGAHIVEGYGQTECTAMATCSWPGELKGGHCGGPASCTLLKLADVPDLNYFAVSIVFENFPLKAFGRMNVRVKS